METVKQETESNDISTPQATRQQIYADAERHFPSHLRPSLPSQAQAFDQCKLDYISRRLAKVVAFALKDVDFTPYASESDGSGSTVDSQQDSCGAQAADKRRTNGDTRMNPEDANENPVPSSLQPVMEFMRKYRSDKAELITAALDLRSPLDHLPPDKQSILYEALCEFGPADTHRFVTLPEPHGWGLDIGETSLRRFKTRYAKRTLVQKRRDQSQAVDELLRDPDSGDERFAQATERLLKIRLFETVNDPASQTGQIRDLYQTLNRLRQTELAARRLELAQQKKPA